MYTSVSICLFKCILALNYNEPKNVIPVRGILRYTPLHTHKPIQTHYNLRICPLVLTISVLKTPEHKLHC